MESLLIQSVSGKGTLEFLDRMPLDAALSIEGFRVRVTDRNLSASMILSALKVFDDSGEEYSLYETFSPAVLFREMAERWKGWTGELDWEPLEGDFGLHCTQDRTGHVSIRVKMRSGWMDDAWSLEATVMVEAGQLESIARRAESFFGCD